MSLPQGRVVPDGGLDGSVSFFSFRIKSLSLQRAGAWRVSLTPIPDRFFALLIIPTRRGVMMHCIAVLGPDLVVSGGGSGDIITWRPSTGKYMCRHKVDAEFFWGFASAGSSDFISSNGNGTMYFFHHCDGKEISLTHCVTKAHQNYFCIAALCLRVTTAGGSTVKVWDAGSHREFFSLKVAHVDSVDSVAISSKFILAGTLAGDLVVWDARTFMLLHTIHNRQGHNRDEWFHSLLIVGNHVLASSTDFTNNDFGLTDLRNGALVHQVSLNRSIYCTSITSNGRIAVCGPDQDEVVTDSDASFAFQKRI